MKKNGYTLAETLVTLTIIGISAALIAPAMKHLIPSKEKMEFMECYKRLTVAIPQLAQYYQQKPKYVKEAGAIISDCVGFACIKAGSEYTGEDKIGRLIHNLVGDGKYKFSGNVEIAEKKTMVNGYTYSYKYAKEHVVKCEAPNNPFTFYLTGNATIKGFDDKGTKFMSQQFNFYDKGEDKD